VGYSYVFNPLAGAFDTVQNLQTVRAPDNAYIPPTGPTVFSDTFTEASTTLLNLHTPNVGTNWSLALSTGGATYSVFNNGTVRPTTTLGNVGCLYLANNVAPAAAVEVSITASTVFTGSMVVGLVFRYVNSNNFYLLTLSSTPANCILYKKVAGVWTNLGQTSIGMAIGAVWRVRAVGSNIVVYANDVIVKITSDTGITAAGLCGLSAGTIGQNATDDVSNGWQLDNFSVTNYASSGGLVTNGINVTGDIQASGQILGHAQNSAIYPAISFAGDTNTGFYVPSADQLSVTTGGVLRATFNSAGFVLAGPCLTIAGTASAPSYSFVGDNNTGFYNPTGDQLGVAIGGALQWSFDSSGRFFTPDALTPGGAFDILTSDQISNSGGDVGGFVVFNSSDYLYTRFKAPNLSDGAGIFGEGKLFFTSGENYEESTYPGIDFNILATGYGTQTGNFNITIQPVDDATGGSFNLLAGNSNYGGNGGSVNLVAGQSSDLEGGTVIIYAGAGLLDGGNVDIKGGNGETSSGGDVFITGGNTEIADAGGQVVIAGGFDDDGGYGQVQLQTSTSGPIAVFGTGGSIQATTSGALATFTANSGTTINSASTFDGYTIAQVVKALRNYGWLA
jgi:hypothetical protein